uniref:Vav guanine nucleotide exchange factor 1 n=1 Tax=Anser brachyrhynchus TaxID=132585 RepID=A0A8B9CL20_9AVES
MEAWRQCARWLVAARVLPAGHRASSPGGQVWDLAQALRDGVLLCHLLNALLPRAVPPRDICPRPQMSQFLCLRNIRTFLTACADKFGLPKHRLFGAFDLFDVQDFGKVIDTLSTLSWTPIAQSKGFTPFPTEDCVGDDDIYSGLSDLIDDTAEEDDDLYDCVEAEKDDGDEIYEDLMRVEAPPATVSKVEVDRRLCCLQELRQTEESTERRSKVDRYGFLLDKALIICKRRGDSYEAKEVVDLQSHQLRDGGLGPRDGKKWTHTFLLIDTAGLQGYELFFKTRELKKKWLEPKSPPFLASSNIFPEHALADGHDFQMFSFEDTTSCKACQMLLRGTFYQGYRCSRCRAPAHKECLGRLGTCGRAHQDLTGPQNKSQRPGPEKKRGDLGLPKMEANQHYGGVPPPPGAMGPALRLSPGDIVEVTVAEAEQLWWQGRNVVNGDVGWFPCAAVRPFICVSTGTPKTPILSHPRYAGPMERGEAEQILTPRSDGAFLVRQRVKDAGEFAISIKYRTEVKHIKVMTAEGLYRLTEKKAFKGLVELVEFYQRNSLKDCFKALDTALLVPFKEPESRAGPWPPGAVRSFGSAKARYDFCARDRTELTLREGDVIRVLSKKGHPGWWKGEIYGRVGWFPANYVEEDYSEYC